MLHVQYAMFYSVTVACALRGMGLAAFNLKESYAKAKPAAVPVQVLTPIPAIGDE